MLQGPVHETALGPLSHDPDLPLQALEEADELQKYLQLLGQKLCSRFSWLRVFEFQHVSRCLNHFQP